MEILTFDQVPARAVDAFGCNGFHVAGLGRFDDAHIAVLRLGPEGLIGRHPAVGAQLLTVVLGAAEVSGEDGAARVILPGQAALWSPGESHETRSAEGMTALVVEGTLTRTS